MNPNLSLLFDIDGTLTDTDSLHLEAFRALLVPFGRTVTEDAFRARIIGQPNDLIMGWMFPELDEVARAEMADEKERLFRASARTLTPTKGLMDILAWAQEMDVEVGVVTNAPRANGELMLRGLGLAHLLPRMVIGPELARPKPDPLPYLTGLAFVGGHAARAIAFEDSVPGVTSAARAGLFTVGITTGMTADLLLEAGAKQIVSDFTDDALWDRLRAASSGDPLS
jgi:beta-phosphoglucomutase